MLARLAGSLALAASAAVFGLLAIGPYVGAWRTLTVLSGSMKPAFSVGDIVVVTPERARDVRTGQVIAYQIPVGDRHLETHRVVRVLRGGDEPIVETKGDANAGRDPWRAQLRGGRVWHVRAVVPKLGWLVVWGRRPIVRRLAMLVAPSLLVVLGLLGIWRRREEAIAEPPPVTAMRSVAPPPVVPATPREPLPVVSAIALVAFGVGVARFYRRQRVQAA